MKWDRLQHIDWITYLVLVPVMGAGLVSMYAFRGNNNYFPKQLIWIPLALAVSIGVSFIDTRILRKSHVIAWLYGGAVALLAALFVLGSAWKGAKGWFNLGVFAFQPADLMKPILILTLAKYFSRRHVEIARVKHVIISGFYAAVPAVLALLQPDLGSAIIFMGLWFGMVLLSGIDKKHLFGLLGVGIVIAGLMWSVALKPYQKERIVGFLERGKKTEDVQGKGWNVNQSIIAVGSGEMTGKGIGEGTQSRLKFLPEAQTDFIFASFAEEWGFVGITLLFFCFTFFIIRLLREASLGATNFETLFICGYVIFILIQFTIHVGMNIGIMPVTGKTLPFMSYGGSHLLIEFGCLGLVMGMRRFRRTANREEMKNEFLGF